MSAREEISRLLEEWFRLTQDEGRAIQRAAWNDVTRIQSEKNALQLSLTEARQRFIREHPSVEVPTVKNPFRELLGRLLSLETRNSELLADEMGRTRQEQETLEQAKINLRRLQKSYAAKITPVAWNSYS